MTLVHGLDEARNDAVYVGISHLRKDRQAQNVLVRSFGDGTKPRFSPELMTIVGMKVHWNVMNIRADAALPKFLEDLLAVTLYSDYIQVILVVCPGADRERMDRRICKEGRVIAVGNLPTTR